MLEKRAPLFENGQRGVKIDVKEHLISLIRTSPTSFFSQGEAKRFFYIVKCAKTVPSEFLDPKQTGTYFGKRRLLGDSKHTEEHLVSH